MAGGVVQTRPEGDGGIGVPVGAFVGQQLGWRTVFWFISGAGLLAMTTLTALVPRTEPEVSQLPVGQQFRALARPQVLISLLTTALVFGGMFGVFAYIEPLLRDVTGYSAEAIPWLLVLFGVGLFVGNIVGDKAADRSADNAVLVFAFLLPIVILTLGAVASMPIPTAIVLTVLGAVGFAMVPGLQARVLRHATGAATLASATNIAAFNAGNAVGVGLAGASIAAGYGLSSPVVTGTGLTVVGFGCCHYSPLAAPGVLVGIHPGQEWLVELAALHRR